MSEGGGGDSSMMMIAMVGIMCMCCCVVASGGMGYVAYTKGWFATNSDTTGDTADTSSSSTDSGGGTDGSGSSSKKCSDRAKNSCKTKKGDAKDKCVKKYKDKHCNNDNNSSGGSSGNVSMKAVFSNNKAIEGRNVYIYSAHANYLGRTLHNSNRNGAEIPGAACDQDHTWRVSGKPSDARLRCSTATSPKQYLTAGVAVPAGYTDAGYKGYIKRPGLNLGYVLEDRTDNATWKNCIDACVANTDCRGTNFVTDPGTDPRCSLLKSFLDPHGKDSTPTNKNSQHYRQYTPAANTFGAYSASRNQRWVISSEKNDTVAFKNIGSGQYLGIKTGGILGMVKANDNTRFWKIRQTIPGSCK